PAVVIPAEHKRVYARLTTRYAELLARRAKSRNPVNTERRCSAVGCRQAGLWNTGSRLCARARKRALAWPGRQPHAPPLARIIVERAVLGAAVVPDRCFSSAAAP